MGGRRQVGIDAARDARKLVADLIAARGEAHPDLARSLTGVVGTLYKAEVGDDQRLLDALGESLEHLRGCLAVTRWSSDAEVARAISRACAMIHPAGV